MAALLRFGAARACRLLVAFTTRNPSIYQRSSPAFCKEHILKACLPSVNASRFLASETSADEALENRTAEDSEAANIVEGHSQGTHQRSPPKAGQFSYERNVRQLGTIHVGDVLFRTFNEILNRGKDQVLETFFHILSILIMPYGTYING